MTAVLHAAPPAAATGQTAACGADARQIAPKGARRCPECLVPVKPSAAAGFRNMFCCAGHRVAYVNRNTVRGRVLVPLVMAARETRDGSRGDKATGQRVARQARALMQRYREEDNAAGRMGAAEYAALRHKLGHDDNLI